MAFTGVISPAGPMSEADIEASRVYRKLDERGLIQMSALAHFADPSRTSREVREVPNSAVRRCPAQCPVCPKADTARRFMRTRPATSAECRFRSRGGSQVQPEAAATQVGQPWFWTVAFGQRRRTAKSRRARPRWRLSRKAGGGSRPEISPSGSPYAEPFALLGQLVDELHYDLVVRLLLPLRVRRVELEFDADEVLGNADEFRIVEEDGNDGAACNARHENLSLERRPNLVGVVLVQDAHDVAALLAEYLLELSRPRLPEIVPDFIACATV
jgi:hypothetical protein